MSDDLTCNRFIADSVSTTVQINLGDFVVRYNGTSVEIFPDEGTYGDHPQFYIEMDLEHWRLANRIVEMLEVDNDR